MLLRQLCATAEPPTDRCAADRSGGALLDRDRRALRPPSGLPAGGAIGAVSAVAAHLVDDLVVDVDRFAGVAPEAVDHVVFHAAALDEGVVHVCDLQLAPTGWLERLDD